MRETIFENGIQYSLVGDYYLPNLKIEPETRSIGRWGRMHRDYLKEHRPVLFNQLVLSGKLWSYLADINEQAQQRLEVLITQLKSARELTEELKQADQMDWVIKMNCVRSCAAEIIISELIFE